MWWPVISSGPPQVWRAAHLHSLWTGQCSAAANATMEPSLPAGPERVVLLPKQAKKDLAQVTIAK